MEQENSSTFLFVKSTQTLTNLIFSAETSPETTTLVAYFYSRTPGEKIAKKIPTFFQVTVPEKPPSYMHRNSMSVDFRVNTPGFNLLNSLLAL